MQALKWIERQRGKLEETKETRETMETSGDNVNTKVHGGHRPRIVMIQTF